MIYLKVSKIGHASLLPTIKDQIFFSQLFINLFSFLLCDSFYLSNNSFFDALSNKKDLVKSIYENKTIKTSSKGVISFSY